MEVELSCPYCGEPLTFVVDESGGRTQSYVEDCQVCCQPIQVRAHIDPDNVDLEISRLDE
jgi:uncharacterized Zn finger protein